MAAKKLADSPTKLTEFAPLSSDSRPSGSFFSRLFKRSNESTEDQTSGSIQPQFPHSSGNASEKSGSNGTPQKSASREESKESDDQDDLGFAKVEADVATNIPSTPMSAMTQTRNLSSVLKRLSNILDRRSTTPQAYKDSDFKQYWMPDDNCKECYECGDKFNTFRRRHHCRICGQIFCSRCCNQEVPGKIMGYTGYLRVCTYCCKVVLSYAQNYAQNPETSGDLRALSEELKHLANIDSEGHQVAATDLWTPTSRRKHIFDEEQLKRSNSPDISSPGSGRNPFDLTPQSEYSSFDSFQHERKLLTRDSAQLRELWLLMLHPVDGIETQNHRHRLRTYINCFVGSEVVDWLLARDKVASREQAMAIGQAMVDAKWLESVTPNENVFRDEYALYKPGESAPNVRDSSANAANLNESSIMVDEEAEPAWFREIKASSTDASHAPSGSGPSDSPSDAQRTNSIFYVETSQTTDNLEAQKRAKRLKSVPSTGTVSRDLEPWAVGSHVSYVKKANQDASPLPHQDSSIFGMQGITDDLFKKDEFVLSSDSVESHLSEGTNVWQSLDHLRDDNGDRQAFEILRKTHREHLTALTNQLLSKAGLSLKWAETIMNVVAKISLVVRPDVRHEGDDMDIRQYVQIKKLPGGSRSNTGIICGVVCSKNVTHKKMRQTIANPKILLLRAPLVYQRVENKMSSLEPQILQEYEFLRHCVGRIAALKPDVLLVEKAVSRVAQDFILDAGITLVINVKPSVMQRVSRFTQADIVSSIDGLVNKTTLGFCHSFKMLTFNMPEGRQKSLMYFDGCASHLGCTVILRGGPTAELAKVKTILHFMTYVAYHSKLEISFLMDEFAMPPVDNENLLDLGVQSPMSENGTFAEGVEALKKEKETKETEKDSEKEKGNMQKENTGPENVNGQKRDDEGVENKDARKEEQMDAADGNAEEGQSKDSKENQSGKSQREKMKELRKSGEAGANRSSKTEEFLSKCQKRSNSREGKGGTAIEDFSDPLQSYQKNKDESIFSGDTKLIEEKRANVYKFKATLQDVVLSSSPYLSHEVPYLETEAGTLCNLRRYFVQNIYWSEYFDGQVKPRERTSSTSLPSSRSLPDMRYSEEDETKKQENEMFFGLNLLPAHRFVKTKITAPVTDSKNQALLADFRATGGRIWLSGGNEAKNEESRRAEMLAKTNLTLPCKGIDCLDPYNHQRIAVLFSSFSYDSANSPNPCVNPWVVSMDFYGRNDIPLGGFLERYCFRENYLCPSESCDIAMVDHIRRFVHENGCITIISKKLDAPLRGHPSNTIYMWQWCRKCKEVTPVSAASVDTWSMSFAKYLELRFHGHMFTRRGCQGHCTHSLHHDHFQYFGYNHIVASFKYSSMQLREVTLPPIVIEIDEQVLPLTNLVDSAKMLSFKGTAVFSTIMEHLHRLKRDAQTTSQVSLLNDYITEVQNNKEFFRTKIDEVQTWLASIAARSCEKNENDLEQILVEVPELYALSDGLSAVKRIIAESVYLWNSRIVECDQQQKKFEKMKSQNQKEQGQRQSKDITDHVMVIDSAATIAANAHARDSDDLEPTKVISDVIAEEPGEADNSDLTSDNSILDKESSTELDNFSSLGGRSVDATATPSGGNVRNSNDNVSNSNTANQEQNTGPTKLQDEPQGQTGQGQGQGRSSPDIWRHQRSKSSGDGRKFSKQVALVHEHSPTDADKSSEKNLNRASMKNIFSSLLSSSEANPVTMPFSAEEHHLLPPGDRIPVIVLDQEPSSIIAYTLSSPEYEMQLQELKSMLQASRESQNSSPMVKRVKKSDAASSSDSLDVTDPDDFPYFGPGDTADGSTKSSKSKVQPSTNYHIELQFSDNTAKFYCRVYFAEQFQRLRKLIFPEGEDRYIRSLSNCFNWLARGGKSGSTFCKTQDDRFILKQMSRLEVQSFVEFAPGYFQYVTKAFNEQTPTVLAKILGVYRIGYRNSLTGRELKQDLLVMENLFYKRKITQIFDLKGSVRNRLVNTSGKRIEDLVLLDENLLKSSLDNPMYVRPHSKTVLTMAITNDTSFLSSNLVMDYSLLVGLDEANKELVVGIIDYIRTFTWDKKLEMVVKSTYSQLGGQGKMPTVVSPELYRSRFLEAMDRYFLLVPDRWTGLGKNIDY